MLLAEFSLYFCSDSPALLVPAVDENKRPALLSNGGHSHDYREKNTRKVAAP